MADFADIIKLSNTITYAADKHKNQHRKNSNAEPYINHPIGLMDILVNVGKVTSVPVLQAALLHDVVEDTDGTNADISSMFGEFIASIVAEVTDDKSLPKETRKKLQVINAPHKSHEAKLVKLADKLHNLQDLQKCPPKNWNQIQITGYFVWAFEVITGLRGSNEFIEAALDNVFTSVGVLQMSDVERSKILAEYYLYMD